MSRAVVEPRYASVAVPVPLRRLFTYSVDDALDGKIAVGSRVRVPLGHRTVRGTVVEWPGPRPAPEVEVKPIQAVLPDVPDLPADVLELTRFIADYYLCSWGEAIETALPPDPGPGRPRRNVRRLEEADPEALPERSVAQRRLLSRLPSDGRAVTWERIPPRDRRALESLTRRGWVAVEELRDVAEERAAAAPAERPPVPTAEQARVLERVGPALDGGGFATFLLYGATGSGKTEVYLRAAARALERGRGVIYLVPEIGLTPLLLAKISRRFPGQAVVLHSGLGKRERYEAWRRVRRGEVRLVVGTRSAVFAPVGGPDSGWVQRLLHSPEVRAEHSGHWVSFRAVPDRNPATRNRVNALMREKYGFADRFIAITLGDSEREGALAIRLDPR